MEFFSSLSTLFLVVVGITNLILSIVVYRTNRSSATNKIFALLGLNISMWLVIQNSSLSPGTPQVILWLIRLSNFFATPICTLFVLLAHTLPSKHIQMGRKKLLFLVAATIVVMITSLTPLSFSQVDTSGLTPKPTPGPGLAMFMIYVIFASISVGVILFKRLRHSSGLEKQQVLFLMFGILSMLGCLIVTIIIPILVFGISDFVPLFPLYTLFFTGSTAYSIVRHKLFDIRVIATEVFTITLWFILLIRIFLYPTSFIISLVDLGVFLFSIIFGFLLIRSVRTEVEQKEKLTILTQELKSLDLKKNEFINMAAHELRAPLTAIKGFLSMVIAGDSGPISDKTKEFLQDSALSTQRMVRLVNNMLNVSRIEEGRIIYNVETFRMSEATKEIFVEFQIEAQHKGLAFTYNCPPNISDTVYADKDRLQEVVINFVSNAIKYTETGSVEINLSNPSAHTIRLEIVDTGPGITALEQRRLFQKFYRVQAKVGKTIGTGLGLYISKLLIKKFGGAIGVISEENKGSTFWFELPVKTPLSL